MVKITHSKYKNTGLIFEMLVKQITLDILSNKESKAIDIIKNNFHSKSELLKEQKLYNILVSSRFINENKASIFIDSVVNASDKINKNVLRREKYNLIKEIKEHYNIDSFFKQKVKDYNIYASIYILFENNSNNKYINPELVTNSKFTLLEYSIKKENKEEDTNKSEFLSLDKGTRMLVYKKLLERFNNKYKNILPEQKSILKEYINNSSNLENLKHYLNSHVFVIKKSLLKLNENVDNPVTKIKIEELLNYLKPIDKNQKVKEDNLIAIMECYDLIEELKKI